MKRTRVLVTGFEPFGGERTNPSWGACRRLPAAIGPTRVEAQVLERPGVAAMSVATMARALEVAIGAALEHAVDISNPEGREW
jgi:pyroglutamyl-peptidase